MVVGVHRVPAMLAITSLAFMFDEVPEPVWKTSIGNWSSCSPSATASPAAAIRSARSESSSPSSAFARAAAALMRPSQRITGSGTGSPETGKFSTAFCVSVPQSSRCCVVARSITRTFVSRVPQVLVDEGYRHAALADRRRHALDRAERTSPQAKMPGTLVSSRYGSRSMTNARGLRTSGPVTT